MEIQDVQKKELRTKMVSIRTFPTYCEFIKENKISPSLVFNNAIKDLIEKEKVE